MNRDEFDAAMARHDDARLRKILWTVYWRGNAQLRERIEDELRPQDQPKVKPEKELPDPAGVLDEVTTFVGLAKDGAYMAGDRSRGVDLVVSNKHTPPAQRSRGMHERLRACARRVEREPETPQPARCRPLRSSAVASSSSSDPGGSRSAAECPIT